MILLPVLYHEDIDRVAAILRAVGADLQTDSYYGTFILEPLEILGVDAFGEWAVQLKLRIKTVPQRQYEVGRELRKRIRKAFDQNCIAVPFPERLVAVREGIGPAAATAAVHNPTGPPTPASPPSIPERS